MLGIGISYAVAILVTTLSAFGSTRRAATVSPVAALRLDASIPRETTLRRTILGLLLVATAVVAVVATLDPSADTTARILAIVGSMVGALGILLLATVLATLWPAHRAARTDLLSAIAG